MGPGQLVYVVPLTTPEGGSPSHPIAGLPGSPSHPIAGQPGSPSHPIAGYPSHPITLPPLPPETGAPEHPIALPPNGEAPSWPIVLPGTPEHPIAAPPGTVWPPLGPSDGVPPGKALLLAWVVGTDKYRWVVIEVPVGPEHPWVPPSGGAPSHPIVPPSGGAPGAPTHPIPPAPGQGLPLPPAGGLQTQVTTSEVVRVMPDGVGAVSGYRCGDSHCLVIDSKSFRREITQ